jgi:hypothetical protein
MPREFQNRGHHLEDSHETGDERVDVADERRHSEFVVCCCTNICWGPTSRIVALGYLRDLVSHCIGLFCKNRRVGSQENKTEMRRH